MLKSGEYIEYNGKRYYDKDVEYIGGSVHLDREEFRLSDHIEGLDNSVIHTVSVNGEKYMDHGIWQKPKKERLPRKLKKRLKKSSVIWRDYYSQALVSRPVIPSKRFLCNMGSEFIVPSEVFKDR